MDDVVRWGSCQIQPTKRVKWPEKGSRSVGEGNAKEVHCSVKLTAKLREVPSSVGRSQILYLTIPTPDLTLGLIRKELLRWQSRRVAHFGAG